MMCQIAFGVLPMAHQPVLFYILCVSHQPPSLHIPQDKVWSKTFTSTTAICFEPVIQFYHCKLNENKINTFLNRKDPSSLLRIMFMERNLKAVLLTNLSQQIPSAFIDHLTVCKSNVVNCKGEKVRPHFRTDNLQNIKHRAV